MRTVSQMCNEIEFAGIISTDEVSIAERWIENEACLVKLILFQLMFVLLFHRTTD